MRILQTSAVRLVFYYIIILHVLSTENTLNFNKKPLKIKFYTAAETTLKGEKIRDFCAKRNIA